MEEKRFSVYIHTVKQNNKHYVGITSVKPEYRWGKNGKGYNNQVFGKAINKYGWENIEHKVVSNDLKEEEAYELEKILISMLRSNEREYGYNVSSGGEKTAVGSKRSEEFKEKLRIANSGENSHMYGKHLSEETKRKISESGRGRIVSEETKKKMSMAQKGKRTGAERWCSRPVTIDGKRFDTIKDCADYLGEKKETVGHWLRERYPMPKEYVDRKLRFYDDNETVYEISSKHTTWRKVTCDGIVYDNVNECARAIGEREEKIRNWLNQKIDMPKKYIDLSLRYYGDNTTVYKERKRKNMLKYIECDGKIFKTNKECANYYGVDPNKMTKWLTGAVKMPKEFVEKGLTAIRE